MKPLAQVGRSALPVIGQDRLHRSALGMTAHNNMCNFQDKHGVLNCTGLRQIANRDAVRRGGGTRLPTFLIVKRSPGCVEAGD
jgi:hypothetical protein